MGCDIHSYIEYAEFTANDGQPYWKNFTKNNGSRNYVMFGVLAGVRVPEAKLFDPKGMPEGRLGFDTSDDYWDCVAPESNPEWADSDDWVSLEQAERWVESGYSVGERDENGRLRRVSGPDWHSHSWLNFTEVQQAMDHYLSQSSKFWPNEMNELPAEWLATLAAMKAFEDAGKQTRLVFWFDN
ncbi:hypothetical protein [Sphingobium sp. YC-XJ3]|uniref:hypothetical protein n=1 Tax=Sphingobium sp. YC-XJ3 TaxID=3024245 RepID=UPI00235E777A|nr:hypothetical protein [Sphingobium sp. YC-XJ3]WDA37828.1 hypothetical protein PO876_06515 [Sphingobium sp. YC-XJ3]